ncbi:MAG: transcriptional regulator GcvA [Granulosicoccus sp.]
MPSQLPLNALNAFAVAARLGSFSKAADEMHVTPAAISQQIRTLEDLLGVTLFHRLNRGLALTEAGLAGFGKLESGLQSVREAVRLMQSEVDRNELNIWTSPSFAARWLMPRMHGFIEQNRGIDLRLSGSVNLIDSDSTAPSLSAEILKAHNIDVAIRFGSGNYPGCKVQRLMDVVAIPLCSPELLLDNAVLPLSSPNDLLKHTLLHDESPYEGRPSWSSWFDALNMHDVVADHNLYFNSVTLALSAAVEGQGVVLTLEQLAQNDIDNGRLVPLFDKPLNVLHAYHLVTLEDAQISSRVRAFRDWISAEVEKLTS